MFRLIVSVALFFCSLSSYAAERAILSEGVSASLKGEKLYSISAAFVAGVADYTGGWSDLPGVKKDVETISETLRKRGFTIARSYGRTSEELKREFDAFLEKYSSDRDARLIFYYAGHGHTLDGSGYIVLKDALLPSKSREGFLKGSLPMAYFADRAKKTRVHRVLFVFDSCFAGSVFSAMRSVPDIVIELLSKPVRQFITSGTEEQLVPDDSVFRRRFIEGLKGGADLNADSIVTGSELGAFLKESVANYTSGTQTPVYGKMVGFDGEFIFINNNVQALGDKSGDSLPEREELLAVIKKNPHSPDAERAMARLREIDESLKINPPVLAPESKGFKMTAKAVKRVKYADQRYPYIMLAPVKFKALDREFKTAVRIKALDGKAYKRLKQREAMLRSVFSRRLAEANLQFIDDIPEMRVRIRKAASEASGWVCPSCLDGKPVIAGLAGL